MIFQETVVKKLCKIFQVSTGENVKGRRFSQEVQSLFCPIDEISAFLLNKICCIFPSLCANGTTKLLGYSEKRENDTFCPDGLEGAFLVRSAKTRMRLVYVVY